MLAIFVVRPVCAWIGLVGRHPACLANGGHQLLRHPGTRVGLLPRLRLGKAPFEAPDLSVGDRSA